MPGREAATLDEDLVDTFGMTGTRGIVGGGIASEEVPSFVPLDASRHSLYQGGGLCTQRPPTIVATISTLSSSSAGHSSGSRERTTRSAR